eukprot:scaffold1138_cov128-Cylindrotheca_fusiformis.AAC.16
MAENGESSTNDDNSSLYKSMLNSTLGLGEFKNYSYLFEDEDDDDDSLLASPSSETSTKEVDIQSQDKAENDIVSTSVSETSLEPRHIGSMMSLEPRFVSRISNRNQQLQTEWENQQKETQKLEKKLAHATTQVSQQESRWKQERDKLLSPPSSMSSASRQHQLNPDQNQRLLLQIEREKRMEIEVQYNALKQQQTNISPNHSMRMDTLKNIQKSHQSEIEALRRHSEAVQAQLAKEKEDLAKEKRALAEASHRERLAKTKLQKEKESLEVTLRAEQESKAKLEEDCERLRDKLNLMQSRKEELDRAFEKDSQLAREKEELAEAIDRERLARTKLEKENESLQATMRTEQENKAKMEQNCEQLKERLALMQSQKMEELDRAFEREAQLAKEKEELTDATHQERLAKTKLEKENESLEMALRTEQKHKAKLEEDCEQLRERLDLMQSQKAELDKAFEKVAQLVKEKEELTETTRRDRLAKSKLERENERLEAALQMEQESKAKLEENCEQLSDRLDRIQIQNEELDKAFEKDQKEKQMLSEKIERLDETLHQQKQVAHGYVSRIKELETEQKEETNAPRSQIEELLGKHQHERQILSNKTESQRFHIENMEDTYSNKKELILAESFEKPAMEQSNSGSLDTKSFRDHVRELERENEDEIQELKQRLEGEKDEIVDWSVEFEMNSMEAVSPLKRIQQALSPISPPKSSKEANNEVEDAGDDVMIEALLDEIGQMDREREDLLKELAENGTNEVIDEPDVQESERLGESLVSADSNSSNVLDQTLTLLGSLKVLMDGQGEENLKESSVLEQLGILSEMLQGESDVTDMLDIASQLQGRNQSINIEDAKSESSNQMTVSLEDNKKSPKPFSPTQENPWPELMKELRNRIRYLEHDRAELGRIFDEMSLRQRKSHKLQVDAAVATAKRESLEQLRLIQTNTRVQMKTLYNALCTNCQQMVYARK